MAMECSKTLKLHRENKSRRKSDEISNNFEDLVEENLPSWNAVWSVMLQYRKGHRNIKPVELKQKIQRKISDLLDKEEILLDLYQKAAEEAKRKEEEFKVKTAFMLKQIEKDKNLMKIFEPAN